MYCIKYAILPTELFPRFSLILLNILCTITINIIVVIILSTPLNSFFIKFDISENIEKLLEEN